MVLETIVRDTGIGIDKDVIPTLFRPFGQLKRADNFSIGVGLQCTEVIINTLRGKAFLVSTDSNETVFQLEMPCRMS